MDVDRIINSVGGRNAVVCLTGLSPGQISHWVRNGYIASHWIRFFIALKPELDWFELLQGNTLEYTDLLNHEPILRTRFARLGGVRKSIGRLKRKLEDAENQYADDRA
ncbi:hypothetical protein ACGYQ5_14375 [Burkholderia pseudomallei]